MVEIADELRSMFSAEVERVDGDYVVRVPTSEVRNGAVATDEVYRVALLARRQAAEGGAGGTDETAGDPTGTAGADDGSTTGGPTDSDEPPTPPVDEGEVREVSIESTGDQGDGIAKVERGYVVIVPGAQPGDEPRIEIEQVRQNVAFARVLDEDGAL